VAFLAIERHMGDRDWMKHVLDTAGKRASTVAEVRGLAGVAAREVEDGELGKGWAKAFFEKQVEAVAAKADAGAYDYTKLAGGVHGELGDAEWAGKLLSDAEEKAASPFEIGHVGRMRAELGDEGAAKALYRKAVEVCETGRDCVRIVGSFRDRRMADAELREHYSACGAKLPAAEKLRWAEGILELFRDEDWAKEEYRKMAGEFRGDARARFEASQKVQFGRTFC